MPALPAAAASQMVTGSTKLGVFTLLEEQVGRRWWGKGKQREEKRKGWRDGGKDVGKEGGKEGRVERERAHSFGALRPLDINTYTHERGNTRATTRLPPTTIPPRRPHTCARRMRFFGFFFGPSGEELSRGNTSDNTQHGWDHRGGEDGARALSAGHVRGTHHPLPGQGLG